MLARFLHSIYRRVKLWIEIHKPPVITFLFFAALDIVQRFLAARRDRQISPFQRSIQTQLYFQKYSRENPPFMLHAEGHLASSSADHISPRGALYDNSTNPRFNQRLYEMFGYPKKLAVLDCGCSGGGFVKSILEDGYTACGVDGSDVSKRFQRAEWKTIPLHLFTCDITRPFWFEAAADGNRFLFDVITAWEVLEHIPRECLPSLMENLRTNLAPNGIFVCSVDTSPDTNPNLNAVYHLTLEKREWWLDKFREHGLVAVENHKFQTQDWVRGNGQGLMNWDPSEGEGFHLVLRKADPVAPTS